MPWFRDYIRLTSRGTGFKARSGNLVGYLSKSVSIDDVPRKRT